MSCREGEPSSRPEHAAYLLHETSRVRNEGHDPVGREDGVEDPIGKGESRPVARGEWQIATGPPVEHRPHSEHPDREVGRDDLDGVEPRRLADPARALGGPAADLEDALSGGKLQDVEFGLGPPFRSPDEASIPEEFTVLGVIGRGLVVPPGPVRSHGLVLTEEPAGGTGLERGCGGLPVAHGRLTLANLCMGP